MTLFQAYMYLLIFLSLAATSPAVAKHAKTGCNDSCGNNVTIPFPFGIGVDCAVNKWYIVECNNSTPYLPAVLNRPEVLGVNLKDQTVTVWTPKVSGCQNSVRNGSPTMSMNLGGSPFIFSKSRNKFVFQGCGTATMMTDDESVVTACSSACLYNVTFSSDRNNCFGNGCCQTAIPGNLRSYSIITGLGDPGDSACGSAFLVDQTLYDEQRNASFIPISLLWTLTNSDQFTCCNDVNLARPVVGMFNDAPVDTLKCGSSYRSLLEENPYLIDGCGDDVPTPKYVKTGCNETCGNNVTIPFPFGIGANCAANQWYIIDCNNSTPYLSALNHLKVLGVDLKNQTVTVGTPRITDCHNPVQNSSKIMGVDLGGSPFLFSRYNKFVFKGCRNAVMMMDNGSVLTGCSTTCRFITLENRKKCFGTGDCCETNIPYYFKSYGIKILIGGLEEKVGGCGSAFLVDETSYHQESWFSDIWNSTTSLNIPVSFRWTLTDSDTFTCCDKYPPERGRVDMLNGITLNTRECYVPSSFVGNSFLIDGCKYKDNDYDDNNECTKCKDSGGYCQGSYTIYDVDGLVFGKKINCYQYPEKRTYLRIILGNVFSISLFACVTCVLFLVGFIYFLYKWIKKTKEKRQRKRFFKRNGGLLLKQQEEADPSLVDKTIHFTSRELQKATDNFNENRILGRGGQGTVYKGMLVDGRIVAVKKSKIVDESQLEHFINEVVILSQINHRNVVKLLGCCLETEVPILVSEFIPNGTLYDRLHNETDEFLISLDMRLQIATEVATMEEGRVMSIFDAIVIKEGTREELMTIANLAMQCLNFNGKYRPTMKEVSIELETIRMSHIPSKVQTDAGPMVYGKELLMLNYAESSSTFLSFNDSLSQ
ncbi:hypothetical protein E3N88_01477 [Mikania micrantha]|uniref:Protein kinase domain-containing protein n=1 Tax=Mikania micrantha TaxID=192012 RepID=A0A5N6Q2Z4_9ASTR|nr:hypothetical protein E3N88_01477 [Mikania micrantha]